MNTLRGWITTTCLVTVLMATSAMTGSAGVIIGGIASEPPTPCSELPNKGWKNNLGGVIIGGLTGVIIGGLTGVIIGGLSDEPSENCGVIIGG